MFIIQDIWNLEHLRYCNNCGYKQTNVSFVPYGEATAELVDTNCALLNDVNIPESECPAYADYCKGDSDE